MAGKDNTRGYHEVDWRGATIFQEDDGEFSSPNEDYVRDYVNAKRKAAEVVNYGHHEGDPEPEPKLESGRTQEEEDALNANLTATTQTDGRTADTEGE